jgi:hypothetical protein
MKKLFLMIRLSVHDYAPKWLDEFYSYSVRQISSLLGGCSANLDTPAQIKSISIQTDPRLRYKMAILSKTIIMIPVVSGEHLK